MKRIVLLGLVIIAILCICVVAFATATSETGDTRAKPKVAYGKTAGGVLKPILVDTDGTVQTS